MFAVLEFLAFSSEQQQQSDDDVVVVVVVDGLPNQSTAASDPDPLVCSNYSYHTDSILSQLLTVQQGMIIIIIIIEMNGEIGKIHPMDQFKIRIASRL